MYVCPCQDCFLLEQLPRELWIRAQPHHLWATQVTGTSSGNLLSKYLKLADSSSCSSVPSSNQTHCRNWVSRSFSRDPPHLTHLSQTLREYSRHLSSTQQWPRPRGQCCTWKTPGVFLAYILSNSVNLKHRSIIFSFRIAISRFFLKRPCILTFPLFFPTRLGRYLKENSEKALTSQTLPHGRHVYDVLWTRAMTSRNWLRGASWTSQTPTKYTGLFPREPKKVGLPRSGSQDIGSLILVAP